MKIKLRHAEHTAMIRLFPNQMSLRELEAKVRAVFNIYDRYLLLSYTDPKGAQTLLLNDEEFAIMRQEFMVETTDSSPPTNLKVVVRKLTDFLSKNPHFCVENSLQVYFSYKVQKVTSLTEIEQEIGSAFIALIQSGVNKVMIRRVMNEVVRKFLKDFENQSLQISNNGDVNDKTKLHDLLDILEQSSIEYDTMRDPSFFTLLDNIEASPKQSPRPLLEPLEEPFAFKVHSSLSSSLDSKETNSTSKESHSDFGFIDSALLKAATPAPTQQEVQLKSEPNRGFLGINWNIFNVFGTKKS